MYDEEIESWCPEENDIYQAFKDFLIMKKFREILWDILDDILWDDEETKTEE
jgi:hypothetical protein